jgi:SAM-dependent methyltransferase
VRTGADVVPLLLSNTQACTPRKAFWVGDHRSVCRVLPRVTPASFDYAQGARALGRHVKDKMLAFLDQDWRLSQGGKSFRHNIRSLYNYRGAYVERYVAWKLRLDPIYGHIDELVPDEGLVLDLGCGFGLMANILARRSPRREVCGVDLDERKIAVARGTAALTGNVAFELADLFEWEAARAAAVVLVDVCHYWTPEQQRRLIARAAACLDPGGTLVFREACATGGWHHRLTVWSERFSTASGHNRAGQGLHFATREFYLQAFEQEGLSLVSEPEALGRGSNRVLVLRKAASSG